MKINGTTPRPPVDRASSPKIETESHGTSGVRPSTKVQVSTAARKISEARGPEVVDEARVERLRAQVEDGTLSIDADAIAAAMLREER